MANLLECHCLSGHFPLFSANYRTDRRKIAMRRLSNRYLASLVVLSFVTLSVLRSGVRAVQNSKPESWSTFTVDDMLDVANANAASLSNDGHWLAATTASL